MLDLDLARLADGHDRSPDDLVVAVWSKVDGLEKLGRILKITTRLQLVALAAAAAVSVALGLTIAAGLHPRIASERISSASVALAPSTLLEAVPR